MNRDPKKVIIIDDDEGAFRLQKYNGIKVRVVIDKKALLTFMKKIFFVTIVFIVCRSSHLKATRTTAACSSLFPSLKVRALRGYI